MITACESDVSHMQMNVFSLKFNDFKLENKYKYERTSSSSQVYRWIYAIVVVMLTIYIIIDSTTDEDLDQIRGFLRAGFTGFFALAFILVYH